jgi:hypothetical protein
VFQEALEDPKGLAGKFLAHSRLAQFSGFEVNLKYPEPDNPSFARGGGFHLLTPGEMSVLLWLNTSH